MARRWRPVRPVMDLLTFTIDLFIIDRMYPYA